MKVISIARDGLEIGDIDFAMLKAGLKSGFLLKTDIGWYDGLTEWLPLPNVVALLKKIETPQIIPEGQSYHFDPASDRQKEFLAELGVTNVQDSLTKEQASALIQEALERKKEAEREERHRLEAEAELAKIKRRH